MAGRNILFIFCCIMLNGSTTGFPFQADDDVRDSGSGIARELQLEGFFKINNKGYPKPDLENDKGLDASGDIKLPISDQDPRISSGEVEYIISEHDVTNTESGTTLSIQLEPGQFDMTGTDISGKNSKNNGGIMINEEQVSAGHLFQRKKYITHAPNTNGGNKETKH